MCKNHPCHRGRKKNCVPCLDLTQFKPVDLKHFPAWKPMLWDRETGSKSRKLWRKSFSFFSDEKIRKKNYPDLPTLFRRKCHRNQTILFYVCNSPVMICWQFQVAKDGFRDQSVIFCTIWKQRLGQLEWVGMIILLQAWSSSSCLIFTSIWLSI